MIRLTTGVVLFVVVAIFGCTEAITLYLIPVFNQTLGYTEAITLYLISVFNQSHS